MYRSIAVTTDFSEDSKEAFEVAALVAKKFGAKLCLLNVSQNPTIMTPWQVAPGPDAAEKRRKAAQSRLEDLARNSPAFAGMQIEARAVQGDSADAVCDFQEREHANLLVMATRGHSGIKHFLLGSFTAKVLQLASCPILVFRTYEDEGEGPRQPFSPSRILVPCDFSRHSRRALEGARSWATAFGSMVKVLYVVEQYVSPDLDPETSSATVQEYYEKQVAEASAKLEELVGSSLKGVPSEIAVSIGHPGVEILEEAESFGARLIAMSSRGLSALDRIAMGSVAERVIQRARCPVLVTGRNPA